MDGIDYQFCFNFRMETHGEPGKIQLSSATKAILDLTESGKYNIYPRGQIDIKVLNSNFKNKNA